MESSECFAELSEISGRNSAEIHGESREGLLRGPESLRRANHPGKKKQKAKKQKPRRAFASLINARAAARLRTGSVLSDAVSAFAVWEMIIVGSLRSTRTPNPFWNASTAGLSLAKSRLPFTRREKICRNSEPVRGFCSQTNQNNRSVRKKFAAVFVFGHNSTVSPCGSPDLKFLRFRFNKEKQKCRSSLLR